MSSDAIIFFQGFFPNIWRLFTSWYIPGTHMTPASLIVGMFMFSVFIGAIKMLFNLEDKTYDKIQAKKSSNSKEE